jgi:hypothetical protein
MSPRVLGRPSTPLTKKGNQMKEITIQLSHLVSNYASNMADFVFDHNNDTNVTSSEAEKEAETFIKNLRFLLSPKQECVIIPIVRRLFKDGHTALLMGSKFEEIETAYANDEEFCVVVKNLKKTIFILCLNEMSW